MDTCAHTEMLVSTDWVARHQYDENICLLEVDADTSAYQHGHIPGARGVNWTTVLSEPGGTTPLAPASFEQVCRSYGISNETTVVFYGDHYNWFATYAFWLFCYYGHDERRLKLMDGGRSKWIAEGRSMTAEIPSPASALYRIERTRPEVLMLYDDLVQHTATEDITLLDVRTPAEYRGDIMAPPGVRETTGRAGHIPGAINIPWALAVREDGTFKTAPELVSLFKDHGADLSKPTVTYCRIGERAAHTWFVLRSLLGIPIVSNYTGSWREWGNQPDAPVTTGNGTL